MTDTTIPQPVQKTELPNKPSELILLALEDVIALERSNQYTIDMGVWHDPLYDNYNREGEGVGKPTNCHVCMAGAVMARRLDVKRSEEMDPGEFAENGDRATAAKLDAIDSLRSNHIHGAVFALMQDAGLKVSDRLLLRIRNGELDLEKVAYYGEDRAQFKRDMRKLARNLFKEGL